MVNNVPALGVQKELLDLFSLNGSIQEYFTPPPPKKNSLSLFAFSKKTMGHVHGMIVALCFIVGHQV